MEVNLTNSKIIAYITFCVGVGKRKKIVLFEICVFRGALMLKVMGFWIRILFKDERNELYLLSNLTLILPSHTMVPSYSHLKFYKPTPHCYDLSWRGESLLGSDLVFSKFKMRKYKIITHTEQMISRSENFTNTILTLQKKLAKLPEVDMQKFPGSFCCYSNHSPKLIQQSFDEQSLCTLHSDCAKKSIKFGQVGFLVRSVLWTWLSKDIIYPINMGLVYASLQKKIAQLLPVDMQKVLCKQVESGWQHGWSMLHFNCRQLSRFLLQCINILLFKLGPLGSPYHIFGLYLTCKDLFRYIFYHIYCLVFALFIKNNLNHPLVKFQGIIEETLLISSETRLVKIIQERTASICLMLKKLQFLLVNPIYILQSPCSFLSQYPDHHIAVCLISFSLSILFLNLFCFLLPKFSLPTRLQNLSIILSSFSFVVCCFDLFLIFLFNSNKFKFLYLHTKKIYFFAQTFWTKAKSWAVGASFAAESSVQSQIEVSVQHLFLPPYRCSLITLSNFRIFTHPYPLPIKHPFHSFTSHFINNCQQQSLHHDDVSINACVQVAISQQIWYSKFGHKIIRPLTYNFPTGTCHITSNFVDNPLKTNSLVHRILRCQGENNCTFNCDGGHCHCKRPPQNWLVHRVNCPNFSCTLVWSVGVGAPMIQERLRVAPAVNKAKLEKRKTVALRVLSSIVEDVGEDESTCSRYFSDITVTGSKEDDVSVKDVKGFTLRQYHIWKMIGDVIFSSTITHRGRSVFFFFFF
ncbi:hypothetical protein VP01_2233g1 [Puccinia sorghi]|uniref:Uncharacterized protein n=1 Tax=Puccinia sorghi TaxID=27349 RepID=A0A0L6V8T9_9BASI|nr:hypothetical protein VP01_2233g1 [Puccinia sorghi]